MNIFPWYCGQTFSFIPIKINYLTGFPEKRAYVSGKIFNRIQYCCFSIVITLKMPFDFVSVIFYTINSVPKIISFFRISSLKNSNFVHSINWIGLRLLIACYPNSYSQNEDNISIKPVHNSSSQIQTENMPPSFFFFC